MESSQSAPVFTSEGTSISMAPCTTKISECLTYNGDFSIYRTNGISKPRPFRSVGSANSSQNILYNILSQPAAEDTTMVCETAVKPNFMCDGAKTDFLVPGEYRERSLSMGSTVSPYTLSTNGDLSRNLSINGDLSRNSSKDSLASIDSESSNSQLCSRLGRLLMAGSGEADPVALAGYQGKDWFNGTYTQSDTAPFAPRKHSEGSQKAYLKHRMMAYKQMNGGVSSRRAKPYSRPGDMWRGEDAMDESLESSSDGMSEKEKRERSNSLSVYEVYRWGFAAMGIKRQRVTLAKKNLLPIVARVSDRLSKLVDFATSLPEFTRMPLEEQIKLLVGGAPRLLLLYMAEMNLQFATTPVHEMCEAGGDDGSGPTLQFVDAVQSFIKKCQKTNITTNEYFYMRMIALFHTGCVKDLSDTWGRLAECTHSEARQDLQELVQHTQPNDRQRYTTLLFALLTLYGINTGMITNLFCQHVFSDLDLSTTDSMGKTQAKSPIGNLECFIRDRLTTANRIASRGGVACEQELYVRCNKEEENISS